MSKIGLSLGKLESNIVGLMHSALDIQDPRIHVLTQWLYSGEYTSPQNRTNKELTPFPLVAINHPIKFANFSGDKHNNYCGYGLKSINKIPKGENIL
jgi:hypothetical protein